MRKNDRERDDRAIVREALSRASEGAEPDRRKLVDSVPALMAEADRRRRSTGTDPISALVPLAWKLIPRLAAATAVLVLVSATLSYLDRRADVPRESFDALIYGGTDAQGDLIIEAIFDSEYGDG